MRTLIALIALACVACDDAADDPTPTVDATCCAGDQDAPDGAVPVDAAPPRADAAPTADAAPAADAAPGSLDAAPLDAAVAAPDAAPGETRRVPGGDASGAWCGVVELLDTVRIPAGETLTLCAGAEVRIVGPATTNLTIVGTLRVEGTAEAPVRIRAAGGWRGLRVAGTLDADHLELSEASQAIEGGPMGTIAMRGGRIERCQSTLHLTGGGTFDGVTILGGASVRLTGGQLVMRDSVIDLQHDTRSPDCTDISGGGVILDHVRFTGCHCPMHINAAPAGIEVTNSVLDGATYPVMIAQTEAVFTGNHFDGIDSDFLDIGGGFTARVAGNYFGGDAPRLESGNPDQFVGGDDWSAEPFPGAGPRN